ncbi:DUF805 domain-containing protein [Shewanella sp. 202IG2-18]|uniref:DUF805 domain-containing protein n=1 Tax=Parashewanella hymeniacidonis TaxID=2807618 RepID=UPI00195F88F5|nr:DUF805 domain-containing protein [Parashewanella hymeniacidonis]MBM7073623.1 DUF805 domain-containing protein [Parashewanella hymeniacidonis]
MGSFDKQELKLVESCNYCQRCYSNLFSKPNKKISEKVVEKIAENEKAKVKTTSNGRTEYVLNTFMAWVLLPVFMSIAFASSSTFSMVKNVGITSSANISISPSWLWLLPVILSVFFTSSRVQDLNWKLALSFVLWIPGLNILLFLLPGTSQKNSYGLKPKPKSKIFSVLAILLGFILCFMYFTFYVFYFLCIAI